MEHKITDADFWKTFAIISVIIIVLAIFIAIISNVFASYSSSGDDNYKTELQSLTNDRTKPSGKINLQSNPSIKPKSKPIVTASKKLTGKEVYNAACMSCHASGAAGAPMTGNKDQWSDRLSKGKEVLYSSAVNGIGVMPAKGGIATLSNDEVKSAVDYLISELN